MEFPTGGGTFTRQKNGQLKRVSDPTQPAKRKSEVMAEESKKQRASKVQKVRGKKPAQQKADPITTEVDNAESE